MDANHLSAFQKGVIGVQFLFVAFGSTVLVPLLVGLDPSTALLTAGIGTLIFHLVTKGIVPIFLGSSFAFIAPIIKASELYGMAGALSGMVAVGLRTYEPVGKITRHRLYQETISPDRHRSGNHINRAFPGRLRGKNGKRELGIGPYLPNHCCHRLSERQGTAKINPYILRNHCRISRGTFIL